MTNGNGNRPCTQKPISNSLIQEMSTGQGRKEKGGKSPRQSKTIGFVPVRQATFISWAIYCFFWVSFISTSIFFGLQIEFTSSNYRMNIALLSGVGIKRNMSGQGQIQFRAWEDGDAIYLNGKGGDQEYKIVEWEAFSFRCIESLHTDVRTLGGQRNETLQRAKDLGLGLRWMIQVQVYIWKLFSVVVMVNTTKMD